ncbi:hypothetical protein IYQ92_06810 [Streptococcus sp. HF-1907]|uniref:hypothetical protein n=1 Tax=Streptococcus sp. HF-1907 TaxID=2785793 RepID=UPI00189D1520|nr:hypothetical protein [Streptococcus sp. HF-1907]MBF7094951.1 hypothetical protein [Streptococcus sp. HF-1907]
MLKELFSINGKMSKANYKKYLWTVSTIFITIGLILLILPFFVVTGGKSDFDAGLSLGAGIALILISLYFIWLPTNEKLFNRYYISVFDERTKFVTNLTCKILIALLLIGTFILWVLYLVAGVTFTYSGLLTVFFYLVAYGFIILRWLLMKLI